MYPRRTNVAFHRIGSLLATAAAVLSACYAVAQSNGLPETRLGVRTAPILLLSRDEIRADLRLSEAQIKAADVEISSLYAQAAQIKGKSGADAVRARRAVDEAQQT